MYVIEILVYSFGFSKKTQREEEIYSRDFYSSFLLPHVALGSYLQLDFQKEQEVQRERLRSHIALRNRKKLQQKWVKYCLSFLDNAPKGVLTQKGMLCTLF